MYCFVHNGITYKKLKLQILDCKYLNNNINMSINIIIDDFNGSKFKYPESNIIELKESINVNLMYKYKETICAFLNNKVPFYLIFGIKDNLDIVGLHTNNTIIDQFICKIDGIISGGTIISNKDEISSKLTPDTIKVTHIITKSNKKILMICVNPDPQLNYQLSNGTIWYRLNASNYSDKAEKMYNHTQINDMIKQKENIAYSFNSSNIKIFCESLNKKDEEILKFKTEISDKDKTIENLLTELTFKNVQVANFKYESENAQDYIISPLLTKINDPDDSYYSYYAKWFCLA